VAGPTGDRGPQGPPGAAGPQGAKGDPASLPQGALVLLLPDDPVPSGFTFVGSFRRNFAGDGLPAIVIRIYRKN
jgi:hypothetical protein